MIKPSDLLHEARALIRTPPHWIKQLSQITCNGRTCYCISGAMNAARNAATLPSYEGDRIFKTAWEGLRDVTPIGSPVGFNDEPTTSHEDMMLLLDAAIGIQQAEEEND